MGLQFFVRWVQLKLVIASQMAKRISDDWSALYNHPVYFLETFVDTEKFIIIINLKRL